MDNMRWIILAAGLAIILGIYLVSRIQIGLKARRQRREEQPVRRSDRRIDPHYNDEDLSIDDVVDEELHKLDSIMAEDASEPVYAESDDVILEKRQPASPYKVISLTVNAPVGVPFRGTVLQGALVDAGLEHGEMDIFHYPGKGRASSDILFSAANIREPGTFDLDAMDNFTTEGVVLFMQIPGPIDAVKAFDEMVATARKLADSLDAIVRDTTNSVLTNQTISHMREEVISYQLQQQVAKTAS